MPVDEHSDDEDADHREQPEGEQDPPRLSCETDVCEVLGARHFLRSFGFSELATDIVWQAIALHTTPGIPARMGPEIAVTNTGVLVDAVGVRLDDLDHDLLDEITLLHPRGEFKKSLPELFNRGLKERPATAYGTINADVLAHFEPAYQRGDMVQRITTSRWFS